jgi:hypothetical protein
MKKISVRIYLQSDAVISQKQSNKNSKKSPTPRYQVQIYTDITKIFIFYDFPFKINKILKWESTHIFAFVLCCNEDFFKFFSGSCVFPPPPLFFHRLLPTNAIYYSSPIKDFFLRGRSLLLLFFPRADTF